MLLLLLALAAVFALPLVLDRVWNQRHTQSPPRESVPAHEAGTLPGPTAEGAPSTPPASSGASAREPGTSAPGSPAESRPEAETRANPGSSGAKTQPQEHLQKPAPAAPNPASSFPGNDARRLPPDVASSGPGPATPVRSGTALPSGASSVYVPAATQRQGSVPAPANPAQPSPPPQTESPTTPAPQSPPNPGGTGPRPTETPRPTTPALVRMVADAAEVTVGAPVSLHMLIAEATDVGSVPFHVLFNSAVLRFERADEGSFLRGGGQQTAFFATPTSDLSSVVVGLSRLGRGDGVGGAGELCTLHFTAVGPGNAGLAFDRAKVKDSENRIAPASFVPASIEVR